MVAHYVNADWELHKRAIGFRLVEVKHSGKTLLKGYLVWLRSLV